MLIVGDVRFNLSAFLKQPVYLYKQSKYVYENEEDNRVLLVWACDEGERALYLKNIGSLFTQIFCDVLNTHTGSINVIKLLSETTEAVNTALESKDNIYKHFQAPQVEQINMDEDVIIYKGVLMCTTI